MKPRQKLDFLCLRPRSAGARCAAPVGRRAQRFVDRLFFQKAALSFSQSSLSSNMILNFPAHFRVHVGHHAGAPNRHDAKLAFSAM